MTNTASSVANPFIGPRSFETGERLFGRDREVRDLLHLLIAERIVLLYSPSGAGKSSLIKAALIPALEKKDFVALPPIRVNQELPQDAPPGANRYVYSTLLSLEERLASAERLPLGTLATFTLATYLQQRLLPPIRAADHDPVLLFDQFEEVLTADPTNVEAKHAFFAQLGEALGDRQLWALFAMREDYVTALDPYLVPVPNRFNDTFRLDLLGVDAARQAMQGPAKAAGVTFSTEAAVRLADDLRRTRVQCADGSSQEVLGPHVEPVQLQVVCLRLWERRFPPGTPERELTITPDDITDVGDVDSALAGYYTDRVRAVAAATGVKERTIRDWVDGELITPQGQRSQVMREAGQSAGLDNRAIMGLIDAHLVRGDERHGTVWFELAHDRLVAPIQQNNAEWRTATLTPFQRQAMLWDEQGRGEGLLLQGAELIEGEQWAEANAVELTGEEQTFLEACRKARTIRQQQERANQRIRQAFVGAVMAALLALGLAGVAIWQGQLANTRQQIAKAAQRDAEQLRELAEVQAHTAHLRELSAQAAALQAQTPQRSLLLGVATQQRTKPEDHQPTLGLATLMPALADIGGTPLPGASGAIFTLAFSPDRHLLAAAGEDGTVRLWRVGSPSAGALMLKGHTQAVTALAFSPDGQTLATASADGTARLWSMANPVSPVVVLHGHTQAISALAFSPDGRTLATASADATAHLWRIDSPSPQSTVLRGHTGAVVVLSFSPDGRTLATGSKDSTVRLWDVSGRTQTPVVLDKHTESVLALAFSPDGRMLATASDDATLYLWSMDAIRQAPITLKGLDVPVNKLAFSPDGHTLAGANLNLNIQLWNTAEPTADPRVLTGHNGEVSKLAFSPDGLRLVSASTDGTTRLWSLDSPQPAALTLLGHEGSVLALEISPDGRRFATAGTDGLVRLWPLDTPKTFPTTLVGHTQAVYMVAFSPDGHTLASASEDATLRLWNMEQRDAAPAVLRGHGGGIYNIAFSPDGRSIATVSIDPIVRVWRTDAPDRPPLLLHGHTRTVNAVAFSPDGHTLITGGVDNTVRVWDLDALNPAKYVLYGHTKSVTTVAISPDGRTLASGGQDGTALVWNLDRPADPALALPLDKRSGSPTMLGDQEGVSALTFSSDGRVLVGGGAKGTLWLWNALALKATPLSIHAHASTIFLLSISHDGRWLASTSADGTIRLWLMDDLAVAPIILRGVGQIAYSTSFSPDDRWLAIGGDNGLVRLWPTQPTALIRQACATAGRNLTLDEWRQYISQSEPYHKLCPDLPRHPSVYADLLAHSQLGEALLAYQEDRSVNPTLDSEASWLVEQAAMLSQERPRQALLIYLLARWRDPQLKGANPLALNHICQASIDNLPTSILLDACDRLLANDSNDLASAYMRGRLRARLGDDAGALSDLQAAQHLAQEQQSYILEDIQRWIDDLKAGRDPLAPTPAAP